MKELKHISVIICTYNRCESLKDALGSLLIQNCDGSFDYEVVVVDNNSKDKTKEVVEFYKPKFNGKLRYIFEPNQGKSYAVNKAIMETKGEIIAFTDDDVKVDESWVNSICSFFNKEDCDVLCGKIVPKWKAPLPKWLTKRFYGKLALLDYGDRTFRIESEDQEFYGANFSIKKVIFNEIGSFNTDLGPKGNLITRGEDTNLFLRLLSKNKKIYYSPNCIVHHVIESNRMQKSYFRKWLFYYGILIFNKNIRNYRTKSYPFGVPYWMLSRLFKFIVLFLKKSLNRNIKPDEKFAWELEIVELLGMITAAVKTRNL